MDPELVKFKDYFKGKFIVYNIANGNFGGASIQIIFQDKPDKLFYAWVYKIVGEEKYELRGFTPMEDIDKNEFQEAINFIKPYLDDKTLGL